MIPLRLMRAQKRYVTPYYLGLEAVPNNPATLASFLGACEKLDPATAELLLSEPEWRGRMTVSWMIGVNRWQQFVPQMAQQLIDSELVYAGAGYCVGLALIANEEAQRGLVNYLATWLPRRDCFYDQDWAMGALLETDRVLGTTEAQQFLAEGGLWQPWLDSARDRNCDAPVDVGGIVALLRGG